MHVAVRPQLAGVALVGASVIAVSSMAPSPNAHLPELLPAIRTAEVNLVAAVDPLAIYSQVLQDALANVSELAANAQPGQVLQAILGNQISNLTSLGGDVATALTTQVPELLQNAVGQLAAGNVEGAATALLGIPVAVGLPALTGLLDPLTSVMKVINAFTSDSLGTELILAGFVAPLISTPFAAVTAVQNVIGAIATANPAAILGAILSGPATVADGLINGGFGPNLAPLTGLTGVIVTAGGLLSSSSLSLDSSGDVVVGTGGPIAALEQVLKKIANALAPQTTAATAAHAATIPSSAAATVTLKTGGSAVSVPAAAAKSASSTTDSGTATSTKVEPKNTAGSDSTRSGDHSSATGQQSVTDAAGKTNITTGKAHKGAGGGKGVHPASYASHSK